MGEWFVKLVKGSMFKIMVVIIKADKSGIYDTLLSYKAKALLNQRIVDPAWYAFEIYRECFDALCQVEAKNDPKIIIGWGRNRTKDLLSSIYKTFLTKDLKKAFFNYSHLHRLTYNFGEVELKIISDREIVITFKDFTPDWKNHIFITTGYVQKFFELCTGKEMSYKILDDPKPAANATHIQLS